ncbi:putative bifunctional diguanylate cyclase/phosphodiesterase [Asaia krungthepensis]|uniref:Diguanylate cyclase n=1 Tax=Asaia krungthepensis NRIC 0535 TaxID=1307925 RepID=A0ABQ0PZY4_9PROT|nr:bifunctional diguanylate cyclase/phosphodiesterase [Asaia krungthepensis]GBQ85742.1 putative diguanylate cyclase [Asaia krungthepensis NRIC 0535]
MRKTPQPLLPHSGSHVLDWLPLLVCHVEPDGQVSFLNTNWGRFSGLGQPEHPIPWTDLLDTPPGEASVFCAMPGSSCRHHDVRLRHHDGVPVQTDLHWQKLGVGEGGGWLLFGHPEADFPLLNAASSLSSPHMTGDAAPKALVDTRSLDGPAVNGTVSSITPSVPVLANNAAKTGGSEHGPRHFFRALRDDLSGRDDQGIDRDRLTGLPNWRAFAARAEETLAAALGKGQSLGFLLIDIDYLGDLNDLYGREIGDLVLTLVADRLTLLTAGEGMMTRSGDDEFSVLIVGDVIPETLAAHAQALLSFVDLPIRIGAQQITFGLSIGAALFPRDGRTLADLQHHALLAANDVKAHGRGGFRLFDRSMVKAGDGVTAQSNLIRRLLRDDLIYPVYQAKVAMADGRIIGAEALMRWYGDKVANAGPEAFPEIFRSYDLATRVSARVHDRVFQDIVSWQRDGIMPPHISINVAPVEFMQDDYAEKLLARLDRYGLSAQLIELELTEHVLYQNSAHYIHRALTLLRRAGMRITLDDFGTGYSSLGFLRDFPVSSIKIDRSFIKQICTDPSMEVIVEAIIRFGEAISVDVVAEGIETPAQLAILQRIGCPIGQGYYFSPPIASTEFARLLSETPCLPV